MGPAYLIPVCIICMALAWNLTGFLVSLAALLICLIPGIIELSGRAVGSRISRKSKARRDIILARAKQEREDYYENERVSPKSEDGDWVEVEDHPGGVAENGRKASREWEGIVGFLHPFCNAGGGGERVLWAAIKSTQKRWPKAICVIYTGDHDANKSTIIERVKLRFNIQLYSPTVVFMYLETRDWVLSTTWPHFTLLGQSLGSLIMAYDAFSLIVPDVFIDTMGYSFTLALSKLFFPGIPTGAYVHYPTISTDMLSSLDAEMGKGVNAGTGKGLKGFVKRLYWKMYAFLYSQSGRNVDVVMTNSSWTQAHIQSLWGPKRTKNRKPHVVEVVFPPVAVEDIETKIRLDGPNVVQREKVLLYVAQFRPEKNHNLILRSFASMVHSPVNLSIVKNARLVLIGSVRDNKDEKMVYQLRLLAHELKIEDKVQFLCDASWEEVLVWLEKSWVGVNGMWNEHFGIGVVEYQAAGLICVVNDSGGPKADIVVDIDGEPTGAFLFLLDLLLFHSPHFPGRPLPNTCVTITDTKDRVPRKHRK